ncbi:MAG: exonuclease domain-containing protein, partial [Tumebacillaceae bacterium]
MENHTETYVVFDLETTGLRTAFDHIIEVGAVRVVGGQITDTFQRLINPGVKLPAFIKELTGLTDEQMEEAPSLEEVMAEFLPFIGDAILVAHNADFDMNFLNAALDECGYLPFVGERVDTLALAQILWPRESSYALESLARNKKLEHNQPHRALSDAMATAELFTMLLKRANELPFLILQQIHGLTEFSDWPLRHFFRRLAESNTSILKFDEPEGCVTIDRLMHRPVPLEIKENETGGTLSGFEIDDGVGVLAKGGPMSDLMSGYEERPQQMEMLRSVSEAFKEQKHLIVEAGTGTGKSLAYLIPA